MLMVALASIHLPWTLDLSVVNVLPSKYHSRANIVEKLVGAQTVLIWVANTSA